MVLSKLPEMAMGCMLTIWWGAITINARGAFHPKSNHEALPPKELTRYSAFFQFSKSCKYVLGLLIFPGVVCGGGVQPDENETLGDTKGRKA